MPRKGSRRAVGIALAAVLAGGLGWAGLSLMPAPEPEGSPRAPVVRRLSQEQYRTVVADIFGPAIQVGGRFDPDLRHDGLLAVGAGEVSVTASGLEQYDRMARSIAAQVVAEPHRSALIGCRPAREEAADDTCAARFLGEAGRLLFRRPVTDGELAGRVAVAREAAGSLGSFHAGLATSLSTLLVSPSFLFRQQVVERDPETGGWRLDAWSKASQLSFLLWNAAPDPELLDAAARGELHEAEGVERQVDRMLASPRLEQGARAFFSDMLSLDGFDTLAKDGVIYPKFSFKVARDAREQTLRTITDLLVTRQGDYRDLFTNRQTFLTPLLASIYAVPLTAGDGGWQAYEFPAGDPRGGLLAQVSFLALHSHPGRSSPTLRGKALRELLLCQQVPLPPANVNFTLEDTDKHKLKTARERLAAHATDPACAGCHRITDPVGLALENFDAIGGYRTTENGAPILTAGELDGVQFDDPAGLGKAVRDSAAAPDCLVARLYAYGTGRPAAKGEAAALAALQQGFARDGYRLPALMRRIALSDIFFNVAPPDAAPAPNGQVASAAGMQGGAP